MIIMDQKDENKNEERIHKIVENKDQERMREFAKMTLANNKVVFDRLAEI